MESTERIAFFGATGGCTNACLAYTLKAGYKAIALARSPSKLKDMLLRQEGISDDILSSNLLVVQGDVTDVAAVKRTLLPEEDTTATDNNSDKNSSNGNSKLVSKIISGIGGKPTLQFSLLTPVTMDSPHICEQAVSTIMQALRDIYTERPNDMKGKKPIITVVSSTGVGGSKDVPFGYRLFYRVVLAEMHRDKKKMEEMLTADAAGLEDSRLFAGVVVVRPTLLVGDQSIDAIERTSSSRSLKVGTLVSPAVGYTVHRAEVGRWMFEEVVVKNEVEWLGEVVTLTY